MDIYLEELDAPVEQSLDVEGLAGQVKEEGDMLRDGKEGLGTGMERLPDKNQCQVLLTSSVCPEQLQLRAPSMYKYIYFFFITMLNAHKILQALYHACLMYTNVCEKRKSTVAVRALIKININFSHQLSKLLVQITTAFIFKYSLQIKNV